MNDEQPPDPTPNEARAIVVGIGLFYLGGGAFVSTFPHPGALDAPAPPAWAVLAFLVALAASAWAQFGGFSHVISRWRGISLFSASFGPRPRRQRRRDARRVMRPRYVRRAAVVLGWNEWLVVGALGAVLAVDLGLFIRSFVGF